MGLPEPDCVVCGRKDVWLIGLYCEEHKPDWYRPPRKG